MHNGTLLSYKENKIFLFVVWWRDLEGISLSEISQTKTNTIWYLLPIEYKKYNKLMNITKKKQITDIENKLVITSWGEGRGWVKMEVGVKR